MKDTSIYYVYAHYKRGVLRYIGKGKGKRAWDFNRRGGYWKKVFSRAKPAVEILIENLDEQSAFAFEKHYIQHSRLLGSKLCNVCDGGEGSSGYRHTKETRMKMSEDRSGEKNPSFGKHPSAEILTKLSESHKGQKSWNKGRVGIYSEETLAKMSESHKRENLSEETLAKMSGKHPSEETLKKLSESHIGKRPTEETLTKLRERRLSADTRAKISESMRGKRPSAESIEKMLFTRKLNAAKKKQQEGSS